MSKVDDTTKNWIGLSVGIIGGLPIGALALCLKELGVAVIGGLFGVVVGQSLNDFIARLYNEHEPDEVYPEFALWITCGFTFIIFAVLAVKLLKPAMIVFTSGIGAYAVLYAIGELTDTWPDVSKDSKISDFGAEEWGYLLGCVALTFVGITTQCKFYGHINHSLSRKQQIQIHQQQQVDPPLLMA